MVSSAAVLDATKNFLCGQVVSVFSLMALVMARRLVYREVYTPILLNMFFYLFLAMVCILCSWCLPPSDNARRACVRWWFYPFLALVDLQANVCAVSSLRYVTFATTGLVLNLAVPFVFTLCVCVYRAPYRWRHIVGCILTLAGGVIVLIGCIHRRNTHSIGSENEVYGWILALLAAALYACSNVINQWCFKISGVDSIIDCLGKVGLWASLLCLIQVLIAERVEVTTVIWDEQVLVLFLGYVLCMFAFYTAVFVLVRATESPMYNLSLLLSGIYLILMAQHALDETLDKYTWAAMLVMLVGLAVYSWSRSPTGGPSNTTELGPALPQISFKSMRTPRDEIPISKVQLSEV